MAQVILDERRDEVVAVIVTALHAQQQFLSGVAARGFEQLGLELLREEFVGVPLVDEYRAGEPPARDQLAGIIILPALAVRTEIARKRLLAPGHAHGRYDRRERGNGFVALRMAQRDRERAVAAHRMAEDALAGEI